MQLMIKPTLACQFKCDFCSAACYKQTNLTQLPNKLKNDIQHLDPENIIVTGGDPLMLSPQFFFDLLSINNKITLSLTTNLWDFKLNPSKWISLFANDRVMVCTSFQYGNRRKKPDGTTYTEQEFINVEKLFQTQIGYVPEFISVISKENEANAIQHVLLAKQLGTKCKLNGILPIGYSDEYYPRYKMLDIQFKIIDLGLEEFESNTLERKSGKCPINIHQDCYKLNRSIVIDENGKYRYSFCEDLAFDKPCFSDINEIDTTDKLMLSECIEGEKCFQCELFRFCNSCRVHRIAAKNDISYCKNMSKYKQRLRQYGYCI